MADSFCVDILKAARAAQVAAGHNGAGLIAYLSCQHWEEMMRTFLFSALLLCASVQLGADEYLQACEADYNDPLYSNGNCRCGSFCKIKGDHIPHDDVRLVWNKFPGPSGVYRITFEVESDPDCSTPVYLEINGKRICKATVPKKKAKSIELDCAKGVGVNKGDKITFIGTSDYPCGNNKCHGCYSRIEGVRFYQTDATGVIASRAAVVKTAKPVHVYGPDGSYRATVSSNAHLRRTLGPGVYFTAEGKRFANPLTGRK